MPGPGRNDPCPCGSGRKVKRCCGEHRGPGENDREIQGGVHQIAGGYHAQRRKPHRQGQDPEGDLLGDVEVMDQGELHGGGVEADSELGRGTTISVVLPIGPPPDGASVTKT